MFTVLDGIGVVIVAMVKVVILLVGVVVVLVTFTVVVVEVVLLFLPQDLTKKRQLKFHLLKTYCLCV